MVLITAGLVFYSQTAAFVWDEGFHLLSAQLIDNGKTPYIDYCFPQTPLNAYWNAFWMHLFGQGWRVTHVVAALELAGAIYLLADWVAKRLPDGAWQIPAALVALSLLACNPTVIQFAPIAQAYAVGMLCSTAAFRLAIASVSKHYSSKGSVALAFGAGVAAGTAAGTTLLTVTVVPVLLVWLWWVHSGNRRWGAATAYCAGLIPPFLPVFYLFARGPKQTWFNVVQYQAIFRRVNWEGATAHDFDVLTAWLASAPALLLLFFAAACVVWLREQRDSASPVIAEVWLCAVLAVSSGIYISTAHPTFQRYFIVGMPFWAGWAAFGFYALAQRLGGRSRPRLWATVVLLLMALSLTRALFDDRDSTRWSNYEQIAAKIRDVTPRGQQFYADEQVYFLLKVPPPPAMEFSYSHKLSLPKQEENLYHIVSEAELNQQVKGGRYATVESCKEERIEAMKLEQLFPNQVEIDDCSIFWGPMKKP
jgi:hypothetical protein